MHYQINRRQFLGVAPRRDIQGFPSDLSAGVEKQSQCDGILPEIEATVYHHSSRILVHRKGEVARVAQPCLIRATRQVNHVPGIHSSSIKIPPTLPETLSRSLHTVFPPIQRNPRYPSNLESCATGQISSSAFSPSLFPPLGGTSPRSISLHRTEADNWRSMGQAWHMLCRLSN